MFNFDMNINQNFASFKSDQKMIFVESFDNVTFEVRAGTSESSKFLETITSQSSNELNKKLAELAKAL
jgi:hypothetical protein